MTMHWSVAVSLTILLHGLCIWELKLPIYPINNRHATASRVVWVRYVKAHPEQRITSLDHVKTVTERMLAATVQED